MPELAHTISLLPAEAEKLARLETLVESNLAGFKRAGLALLEIRDSRLYRAGHDTFEAYLGERWGIHRSHAHRMIEAAKAAARIEASTSPMGDTDLSPAPTSERQIRPLTRLEPEGQTDAWSRAVREAGGKAPSAEHVERAVDEIARSRPELVRERAQQARSVLHSSESAEWYSPAPPVVAAREFMGGIDLDPASSPEANKLVQADQIYTARDNGLSKPWHGRVWLNWPGGRDEDHQSNAALWSQKLLQEFVEQRTTEALCLIFNAATGNEWFWPLWDYPLCFVRGRMQFRRPGGEIGKQPSHSNAILYLGRRPELFAARFAEFGRIVLPSGGVSVSMGVGS